MTNLQTFIHDTAERAIRSFIGGVAAYLLTNTNTAELTLTGIKGLFAGAIAAGVAVVISLFAKQAGDPGTASFNPELKSTGTDTPNPNPGPGQY